MHSALARARRVRLAPGQLGHLAVGRVAGEAERAQHRAQVAPWLLAEGGAELLDDRAVGVEHLGLVLAEPGQVDVGAPLDGAGQRLQLAGQQAQQGGLAGPVRAHEGQLATPLDHQVDAVEHDLAVVAGVGTVQLGHHPAGAPRLGEGEADLQLLAGRHRHRLELLERLDAALDLPGLGRLVAEAVDERLDVGDPAGLAGGGGLGAGDAVLALDDELGEAADVLDGRAVGQLDHPVGHGVDEVPVVADEQQGAASTRPASARARRRCPRRGGWWARRGPAGPVADSRSRASATRIRQPPESSRTGRSAASGAKPSPASTRWASDSSA